MTTDVQESELLAAILQNPADDAVRLIYADWFDERSGVERCHHCAGLGYTGRSLCGFCATTGRVSSGYAERAEFIRVQVELATCDRLEIDLYNEDTDWSECSGISAGWCPNCGDCCCREPEDSMNDDDCPLHSPQSRHCCLDSLRYRAESLRRRERSLLDIHWSTWVHKVFDSLIHDVGVATDGHTTRFKVSLYGKTGGENGHLECEFHRGFVSAVTCTLALWCGEACPDCSEDRWRNGSDGMCMTCDDVGRTIAHGPQLVACCPLEKVTLSDVIPLRWSPDSGSGSHDWPDRYSWVRERRVLGETVGVLSACLFDKIVTGERHGNYLRYDSEAAALDALSVACLKLAKAASPR